MKITKIETYFQPFTLTRPYTIAYKTHTTVANAIVELHTNEGKIGLGAAAPSIEVTKESMEACLSALDKEKFLWCLNQDIKDFGSLRQRSLSQLAQTPAACAAVDIALHDLFAQMLERPLVEILGRVHQSLPTSITIGIKNVEETLSEAAEYFARGFRVLKVKLGNHLAEDIEKLIQLREQYGSEIHIRVDPNQGYTLSDLTQFLDATQHLNIEFIEQPLPVDKRPSLYALSDPDKKRIALDESVLNATDAISAITPSPSCGIFNIKLMKCGGIFNAQRIATIAEAAHVDLMWGCMDESIISITAALHAALACKATRYLDLDGSLDLAQDIVKGGFTLQEGIMKPVDSPGLGVEKI